MDMDDEISFDDFDMDDDTESEVSAETVNQQTEENADETVIVKNRLYMLREADTLNGVSAFSFKDTKTKIFEK